MLCALKKLAVTVDIRENTGRQNVDARHFLVLTSDAIEFNDSNYHVKNLV